MVRGGYERAGQEGEALLILPNVETVDTTLLIEKERRKRYETCVSGVGLVTFGFANSDFEHGYAFNDRRVIADVASIIRDDKGALERFGLEARSRGGAGYHRVRP
jgi:hypothetical protein